ncbi:hypothetical protein [Candidatus Villigracilis proximus]|uniref:hypothetical protein n=1 Tax=Candidatus Villigracilis proximus TaxID=3140683 RepID=UPI0031EFB5FF
MNIVIATMTPRMGTMTQRKFMLTSMNIPLKSMSTTTCLIFITGMAMRNDSGWKIFLETATRSPVERSGWENGQV